MKGLLVFIECYYGEEFHSLHKIIIHSIDNIRGHTGSGLERDKELVPTLTGFKIKSGK